MFSNRHATSAKAKTLPKHLLSVFSEICSLGVFPFNAKHKQAKPFLIFLFLAFFQQRITDASV